MTQLSQAINSPSVPTAVGKYKKYQCFILWFCDLVVMLWNIIINNNTLVLSGCFVDCIVLLIALYIHSTKSLNNNIKH